MTSRRQPLYPGTLLAAIAVLAAGCGGAPTIEADATAAAPAAAATAPSVAAASEVVVYTSVDQSHSEPVLRAFEAKSGIRVRPVFDVEAAKTTGLVNRLIAERARPQADVWWNGEFAQTIALAEQGILDAYASPAADGIPDAYKDPAGLWTGFGGRARVLIVNADRVSEDDDPTSIDALLDPAIAADQLGIAHPVFGTTATQAAALYAVWGADRARDFFRQIADRGVRVVDGNGAVRDLVADGQLAFGLTDTDDACGALARGAPVRIVFPDQGDGQLGTLIIPNTVGLVAGAPHPDAGRALIDYLVSAEAEADLVRAGWSQVALRPLPADVTASACVDVSGVRGMDVSLADIAGQIEGAKTDLASIFVR
ncbi:ABC transporter substrate-binding protein [bacterium]|nr:MAG: ABC transporter substrate-binding protein [bacterium]